MPELQSQPAEMAGAGEIIPASQKMKAGPGQIYAEVEITRKATGEVIKGWAIADVVGVITDESKATESQTDGDGASR